MHSVLKYNRVRLELQQKIFQTFTALQRLTDKMQAEDPAKAASSEFSEAALIEGCRAGRHEALNELVKRYQTAVLRVCVSMIGSREVDDLVQDIFIKILRRINTFEGRSALFTWIYEIAVNHCRDQLRRRKLRRWFSLQELPQQTLESFADNELLASERMEKRELRQHLHATLNTLEPKYRELIVLRDLEGLGYEEIAKICGIDEKRVKSRLYQARQILAAKMKKYIEAFHD